MSRKKRASTNPVDLLAFQIKAMGLPVPIRELHFTRVLVGEGPGIRERLKLAGLKDWRFDMSWPDYMVAMEVDGGGYVQGRHSRGPGMTDDRHKWEIAKQNGWHLLICTPTHIKKGMAVEWIRLALERENATLHLTHQAS